MFADLEIVGKGFLGLQEEGESVAELALVEEDFGEMQDGDGVGILETEGVDVGDFGFFEFAILEKPFAIAEVAGQLVFRS